MKLLNKIFCLFILAATVISCEREYDRPPLTEPEYNGPQANITISEFREKFKDVTQDKPITIEEDLVLDARIISTDETGNIYKTMYIQDETGGIGMLVDQSDVYATYRQGQLIYINLKGLCASFYGDIQIGHPEGYLYRTPWEAFQDHVKVSGWPNKDLIEVKTFSDISKINENSNALKATFVCLTGVTFVDGGKKPYVYTDTENYGTRVLKDAHGNTIDVRTSSYASFAAEILPEGVGNVKAVLGNFNGTWQLSICDINDVYGFTGGNTGEGEEGGEGETPVETTIFEETFATGQGEFTIDNKKLPEGSSYVWKHDSKYKYMKASSYVGGSAKESESWLVSPEIDLTKVSNAKLTFDNILNQLKGGKREDYVMVQVKDIAANNWTEIAVDGYGSGSSWDPVGATAELKTFAGKKIQVAFIYKSDNSIAPSWEVYNVKIVSESSDSSTGGSVLEPK